MTGIPANLTAAYPFDELVLDLYHVAVGSDICYGAENELRAERGYDRVDMQVIHYQTVDYAADKADAYRHEQQSHAVYAVIVRNADEDAAHCHRRHLGQVKTAQQHRHRHACRNNTGGRHINADVFEVCRREEIR